ncbi:lipoprotein NlpI [Vibrio sp. HB161653]|uniref:lipoprotein NlpI n=1 Tax=Vibrio sp. HB161653 TaxID=3068274 RepID=UPI0035305651
MKWLALLGMSSVLLLSGCATQQETSEHWVFPAMAVPLQPSAEQQVKIAQLTQLLARKNLPADVRAKMLVERGHFYDSVGLDELARVDFFQSLKINPQQPAIFNILGVYETQRANFDDAYQFFDSTLELNPQDTFAQRNRAIALYYGERYLLALEDMNAYWREDPSDPFRVLWRYVIEQKVDPQQAKAHLAESYQQRNARWGWLIVAVMLDEISERQAFQVVMDNSENNNDLAERLTELYFYMGKKYQINQDYAHAISLYKLVLSYNVFDYLEHRYTFVELGNIYRSLTLDEEESASAKDDSAEQ